MIPVNPTRFGQGQRPPRPRNLITTADLIPNGNPFPAGDLQAAALFIVDSLDYLKNPLGLSSDTSVRPTTFRTHSDYVRPGSHKNAETAPMPVAEGPERVVRDRESQPTNRASPWPDCQFKGRTARQVRHLDLDVTDGSENIDRVESNSLPPSLQNPQVWGHYCRPRSQR